MLKARVDLARAFCAHNASEQAQLASEAGVSVHQVSNLIVGRPVATIVFLRLCAALGIDPCPTLTAVWPGPADFDFEIFSLAFRLRRGLNNDTVRAAANVMGVGPATVTRIEKAEVMGLGVVLRGCVYIGVHPFGYFQVRAHGTQNVSREASTPAIAPNKQESEVAVAAE